MGYLGVGVAGKKVLGLFTCWGCWERKVWGYVRVEVAGKEGLGLFTCWGCWERKV